ncbi:MAG: hypothetical protein J5503_05820 [Muribaculaceae bacterium]|nr:hypothetical protein [Muribaculaceae bacterium]
MKRALFLLIIELIVASGLEVEARSYYNTVENQFGGLFPHPGMRMAGRYKAIEEDRLIEENATMATAITLDTMTVASPSYRYQLRLANLNNKQGKTRSIKNPMTGEKTTISNTQWGLVFNNDTEGYYCAVVLECDNSTPFDDITDQRSITVKIIERNNSETRVLAECSIGKGISLEDELNTICVDVDERGVKVAIGKNELQEVLEAHVTRPAGTVAVGYLVGPGARVAIERAVLTIDNEEQVMAATTYWTREALDEYFAVSSDPIEGYWQYLDRDMQDEWLRLGGRYTLAIVRADKGYDIIYMGGAQVKKTMWQAGMLKGHLTKTVFSGNYDATWIDATMEPIDEDVQASIENGIILTLSFPVYKSQVRFSKVLEMDE